MNRKKNKIAKKGIKPATSRIKNLLMNKMENEVKNDNNLNKNKKVKFKLKNKANLDEKENKLDNTNKKNNQQETKFSTIDVNNRPNNKNKPIKTSNGHSPTRIKNIANNTTNIPNQDKKDNEDQNKKILSPKKNLVIKITEPSPKKSKNASNERLATVEQKTSTIESRRKEIISGLETLATDKEENEEEALEELTNTIKAIFTPIPSLKKKSSKNVCDTKDVEKAIKLRRKQYNEYLKQLNKPKPKPKPKPKVYDINKVIYIQKIYKAYRVADVNQNITRLKINSCVTELLCLILNHVFRHARRRIIFYMFKNYYHDPFTNIFTEVNFSDKLAMKLSDTYYNFNNFINKKYK